MTSTHISILQGHRANGRVYPSATHSLQRGQSPHTLGINPECTYTQTLRSDTHIAPCALNLDLELALMISISPAGPL